MYLFYFVVFDQHSSGFCNFVRSSRNVQSSCQTSEIELFAKIINGGIPLTILAKRVILDLSQGYECASEQSLRVALDKFFQDFRGESAGRYYIN